MSVTGRDPLSLGRRHRRSFWLESDDDRRKVRWIGSMFATEAPLPGARTALPLIMLAVSSAVGAELCLRIMGFGDPVVYRPDAMIGYYPAPGQSVRRSGGNVETNSFGMRSPEISKSKPAGTLRILMLGDSTLWGGSYVDQSDIYAARLARLLSEPTPERGARAPHSAVEVLCVGVNGWGPHHKAGYVRKFGVFEADVAFICLPHGDVFRSLYGLEQMPFLPEHSRPTLALQEVIYHLTWRFRAGAIGPTSPQDLEYLETTGIGAYAELARGLLASGCEVFVEILPSRQAGLSDGTATDTERRVVHRLQAALEPLSITAQFPAGLFAGGGATSPVYHDDCHLDVEGHRLYADYLAERVRRSSSAYGRWAGSGALGTSGAPAAR